jgi:hypothetical protein
MFYKKVSPDRLLITLVHPPQNNYELLCQYFSSTSQWISQRNILKDTDFIAEQNDTFKLL